MNASAEQCLREIVLPELEAYGRPDYDRPHTLLVASHIEGILGDSVGLGLEPESLPIAGLAHDWGYAYLARITLPITPKSIKTIKAAHMALGAAKLSALMERRPEFGYLSTEQKQLATHLVAVHDNIEDLEEINEIALMEADTLAFLDPRNPSTYTPEQRQYVWQRALQRRVPRFETNYSRRLIDEWMDSGAETVAA